MRSKTNATQERTVPNSHSKILPKQNVIIKNDYFVNLIQ